MLVTERVQAQAATGRLRTTYVDFVGHSKAQFVRDSLSGGCWIAVLTSDGYVSSLAVAPNIACQ